MGRYGITTKAAQNREMVGKVAAVLSCTEDYGRRLLHLCPHLYPHLKSVKPFNFTNSNFNNAIGLSDMVV